MAKEELLPEPGLLFFSKTVTISTVSNLLCDKIDSPLLLSLLQTYLFGTLLLLLLHYLLLPPHQLVTQVLLSIFLSSLPKGVNTQQLPCWLKIWQGVGQASQEITTLRHILTVVIKKDKVQFSSSIENYRAKTYSSLRPSGE